jgi:hypothetical protein
VAETSNDPGDNFPVTMSADEHMATGSSIADRHHQLLGMPKRENAVLPLSIQPIERLMTTSLTVHRACDATNGGGSDGRQE